MTSISMKKELAEELVDFKLQQITEFINEILNNWNYLSAEKLSKMLVKENCLKLKMMQLLLLIF